jgi:exonuclease III
MENSFYIASLNCNGLNRIEKILNLRDILNSNKIDICFLQETHFNNEKNIFELEKICYEYYIFTKINPHKMRGVAILIRKNIENLVINNFNFNEDRIISVDVHLNKKLFNLVNIYAPNLVSEQIEFIEILNLFIYKKKNLILEVTLIL